MSKRLCSIFLLLIITLSACADSPPTAIEGVESISNRESSMPIQPDREQRYDPDGGSSPEDAQTDKEAVPDTRPRTFYRYTVEDAVWDNDPSHFPLEWLETAKALADAENEHYDGQFTRGWQYDFEGDGRPAAILLLQVLQGDSHLWGNSLFIHLSSEGAAEIITMGQDLEIDDWRKMDIQLLHYSEFSHIFVRSGANNMTSGSFGGIYRENDGVLEHLFSDSWFFFGGSDVFFETQGPQGQGPKQFFWDALEDRYSVVGGTEISPKEFLHLFDADRIIWESLDNMDLEQLEEIPPSKYTEEMFASIEVYGNRYYQLLYRDSELLFFTVWKKTAEGMWQSESIGTGPIRHFNEAITVYGIDMFEAEKTAAA